MCGSRGENFLHMMRCLRNLTPASVLGVLFLAVTVPAADSSLELAVKSAYIYNFIQFIDWQEPENTAADSPLTICVIGSDPIGPALAELTSRKVKGRSIQVRQVTEGNDAPVDCHIVVIARSAEDRLPSILLQLAGANVLTVSDIPQFARGGGGIGFVIDEGKVKIEINSRAIQQAGLKVSAKLMEVARIVQ
jgi:hypothetical protein